MNHIFKTLWSSVHQQYVVTNEKQTNHGKPAKAISTAVVAVLTAGIAISASATSIDAKYVEKGQLGAADTWESPEYKNDWGLKAMNASSAYALGYTGKNVQLGVMDSGVVSKHQEFTDGRVTTTQMEGQWGSSGIHYPQAAAHEAGKKGGDLSIFKKGDSFTSTGEYDPKINDSHGTHCTGTIAAARNGGDNGMHGVAFNAKVLVGNTNMTDAANYGPFQDYTYFKKGWDAIVNGGAKVINNSWGSNIKLMAEKDDGDSKPLIVPTDKRDLSKLNITAVNWLNAAPKVELNKIGDVVVNDPNTEWEYNYFKKQEKALEKAGSPAKSIVDAAYEAVKDHDVVQVFTTGNWEYSSPYYRANAPYFNPELENNWISVTALIENTPGKADYALWDVNYAGEAKWWTIAAPGRDIYSTVAEDKDEGKNKSYTNHNEGANNGTNLDDYGWKGGTSMAAPHVTGAMGVLLERYPDMKATQARQVLFTTAHHNVTGWSAGPEEVVDAKYGWGVPDLQKGMYGPGELLGVFDYHLDHLDVWSNDISEKALAQREKEDQAWMKATENGKKLDGAYVLGDKFVVFDGDDDLTNHILTEEEAKAGRKAIYKARAEGIQKRVYHGSLIKEGEGTLVLTGVNTYKGGTVVKAGKLYGFAQSFGDASQPAEETPNLGKVVVEGGTFGITPVYVDQLTLKGRIEADKLDGKAAITVEAPGTLEVLVTQDGRASTVKVQSLTLKDGATVRLSSLDWTDPVPAAEELKGDKAVEFRAKNPQDAAFDVVGAVAKNADPTFRIEGVIEAENNITGDAAKLKSVDYLKVKQLVKIKDKVMSVVLEKKSEEETKKTIEGMNLSDNQTKILDTFAKELKLDSQTIDEVQQTTKMASEDSLVNAQSAVLMNTTRLTQTIRDQAIGFMAVKPTTSEGNVWGTLVGSTGKVKLGLADTKADYANALVGGDYAVTPQVKVGAFLGAGHGKLKADGFAKTKTTDIHAGVYAHSKVENLGEFTGGFLYTHQKRDIEHVLLGDHKFNTNITSLFAEAACPGFNLAKVNLQPYVGLDWTHFEGKTIKLDEHFSTSIESQNVFASALGARASLPFSVGTWSMSAKADVAWKHFFGSKPSWSLMAEQKTAKLEGEKLSNMGTVGLGVDAQVMKTGTLGLSYQGAFANDAHSHGVMMNFKYQF